MATVASTVELRLERDEIVYFPTCPFAVPQGDDLQFLRAQSQGNSAHKNISFDPATGRVSGNRPRSDVDTNHLQMVLASFSAHARAWLTDTLSRYATGWKVDRASFRPEEEATRRLRLTRRNDLLHVDAFPTRPTQGWRLLRLYVNINPSEPRIWATSLPFRVLLERYGKDIGLPTQSSNRSWAYLTNQMLGIFQPGRTLRTPYDEFMLRMHDFLKRSDEFQEKAPKKLWHFAPGSAWLVFGDSVSHAALRGQFALEHSFFVPPDCLVLPEESPAALLDKVCGLRPLAKTA